MDVERLGSAAAVLEATARDRFARNTIRPQGCPTVGWRAGDAVAWVGLDAEERRPYLQVIGSPAAARAAVDAAVGDLPDGVRDPGGTVPLTVPAAALPAFDGRLRVDWRWRFRACTVPPAPPAVTVAELGPAGDDRIRDLLGRSTTFTSALPGDPGVRRWVVVEDGAAVVACAADTSAVPGLGHMGAVAVAPEARRRGLGAAVAGYLTRDLLLAGHDAVVVGVLEHESAAQRLYDVLGYVTEHEFRSGPLTTG